MFGRLCFVKNIARIMKSVKSMGLKNIKQQQHKGF